LFKPLVSAVAYQVFGTCAGGLCDEARPAVEAWVRKLGAAMEREPDGGKGIGSPLIGIIKTGEDPEA
jgi:hypothetical protein